MLLPERTPQVIGTMPTNQAPTRSGAGSFAFDSRRRQVRMLGSRMLNHWLLTAFVLLFLPIGLLLPRSSPLAGYERGTWPGGWSILVLLLDPFRAGIGAWCLLRGMGPLVDRIGFLHTGEAIVLGCVFFVGVVLQTVSRMDEDYVFAPFAYVGAVLIFFCGPVVALPAIVLGLGSAMAMRVWTPFFFGAGMVVLILGPITNPQTWQPAIAVGLACMVPPLLAVMAGRHMGFPRRASPLN